MLGTRWYLGVGIALAVAMSLLLVTACGGGAAPAPTATQAPTATPIPTAPTATETAKPVPTPTVAGAAVTPTPSTTKDPLVSRGEEVFQKTAGGVGCQACHGRDARGDIGPDIRGATLSRISLALSTVEQMAFIKLSLGEVQAVAAYLQSPASQP